MVCVCSAAAPARRSAMVYAPAIGLAWAGGQSGRASPMGMVPARAHVSASARSLVSGNLRANSSGISRQQANPRLHDFTMVAAVRFSNNQRPHSSDLQGRLQEKHNGWIVVDSVVPIYKRKWGEITKPSTVALGKATINGLRLFPKVAPYPLTGDPFTRFGGPCCTRGSRGRSPCRRIAPTR